MKGEKRIKRRKIDHKEDNLYLFFSVESVGVNKKGNCCLAGTI